MTPDDQILSTLHRVGGWVRQSELQFQLRKKGLTLTDDALLDRLSCLEGEARVRSELFLSVAKGERT